MTTTTVRPTIPANPAAHLMSRCLGCGHRTAVRHDGCIPIDTIWQPCCECQGLRIIKGRECDLCDGVGFIPFYTDYTLGDVADGHPLAGAR